MTLFAEGQDKQALENVDIRPLFGDEEEAAVLELLRAGTISQLSTETVARFEQEFADYIGVSHAVAVHSGTAAVHTALIAAGVTAGQEVIVPAFTFIGTVGPVLHQHAVPVFADIDPASFCLDPDSVEQRITPNTKAILAVDLFGQAADWEPLQHLAAKHGLALVDDACQSHGATYQGKKLGSIAPLTAFSFQESKNMTTGEGGMVTTYDPDLAAICRQVRQQGEQTWGHIARVGYNYRMTALQAAIGRAQLQKLEQFNARRAAIAAAYREGLGSLPLVLPAPMSYGQHVYHVYSFLLPAALAPRRQEVAEALREQGVPIGIAYPKPLYHSPVFQHLDVEPCPKSEDIASRVLTLPTAPSLGVETAKAIAAVTAQVITGFVA